MGIRQSGFLLERNFAFCACISVDLPRTQSAYFLCVLSVLYTASVLILHRRNFSSSAITPYHMLIRLNFTHACWGLGCDLQLTKKKTKPEFQLGRFLWKDRVKRAREVSCLLLTLTVWSSHAMRSQSGGRARVAWRGQTTAGSVLERSHAYAKTFKVSSIILENNFLK